MKNIVIISNFPDVLNGKVDMRFTFLAKELARRGNNVELIISDYDHEVKDVRKRDDYSAYEFKITALHELAYTKNLSIKRLYAHYKWGKTVGKYLRGMKNVPDVVYVAIPSLTVAREAAKYCNEHERCRLFIDIQDLWPEAFEMVVKNGLLRKFFLPFRWYVNYAYSQADFVVGVSDSYQQRGLSVNKRTQKGLTAYIGNDGEVFDMAKNKYAIERNDNEIWLAYIGTLGHSYDIPCAVDAIAKLEADQRIDNIRFVVMGRGPLKDVFEQYAKDKNINAVFTGALPYPEMVGRLCSCDICINPIVSGSAASIINKVGDYALSGLPVINTQENLEYRGLVEEYQCGVNCECGNAEQVADAIERLAKDKDLRERLGANARKLGVERFDRRTSYLKIIEAIEKI